MNSKAALFLIDYAHRRRVKIWGRAQVVEDDPVLVAALMPKGYRARTERAVLLGGLDFVIPRNYPARGKIVTLAEARAAA